MDDLLLEEFERLYQLQEMIADISNKDLYGDLGTTETHCINYIGENKEANGVELSTGLALTRSAISKITKRLIKKGYIFSFKKEDNLKEVFYSLTPNGEDIFSKHIEAHKNWIIRDKIFLETIKKSEKEIVLNVLKNFNKYILREMEKLKDDN